MAVLQQGFDGLLVEKVNFADCFLLQKLLDDSPEEGDRAGDPRDVADEHSRPEGIRKEGEGFLHRSDKGEEPVGSGVYDSHPVLDLTRDEVVAHDVLEEVGLRFE
jgi:hypothetical protein